MHERDLFIAAFEIDDETARQVYLDEACVDDPTLRSRVERLLNRAGQAGNFLEQPAVDLYSDMDAGLLTEANEPRQVEGDLPTIIGQAGDTGQTILLNSAVSAASASNSKVAAPSQSGLNESTSPFGTLFGRYRVERVLGSGGMGVVYLAEDLRLGRRVALKIPKFDADGKLHLSERFRREARTMASVLHRNLCPIFDVDEQDGTHYLTMAFIDGEPLSQIIKQGSSLTVRQIAELIRKLALALDEAHRAGVVHRDLKPANVMIDRSGEPILMDFGLAWMVHEADSRLTQSGAIVGTPAYMSPEQAAGDAGKVGAASDIYSLGAIFYELLTGRPIHTGGMTRVLFKLIHEVPTRPSEICRDIDPKLEEICWKAISHRPEDRFATAADFATALAGFLDRRQSETCDLIPLGMGLDLSSNQFVTSDRTDVLPLDTSADTIVYSKPQTGPRSKSRIVLASVLLIGVLGAVWAIVAGRAKPLREDIVQGGKFPDSPERRPEALPLPAEAPSEASASARAAPHPGSARVELPVRRQFTRSEQSFGRNGVGKPLAEDFDGDGDLDLFLCQVKAPNGSGRFVLFINNGQAQFTERVILDDGQGGFGVAGDLDGDGDMDVLVPSQMRRNAVLFNDGAGVFRHQPLGTSEKIQAAALGDLDGDGDLDVVLAHMESYLGPNQKEPLTTSMTVLWNDGHGQFSDSGQRLGETVTRHLALGDLDGDGDLDLFQATFENDPDGVWLNDGEGRFTDSGQRLGRSRGKYVVLGDLDGDADLDAYVAGEDTDPGVIYFNDGQGRFTDSGQRTNSGNGGAVILADLDGDSDLDVLDVTGASTVSSPDVLWLNDGHGQFTKSEQEMSVGWGTGAAAGDFDRDGDLDLLIATYRTGPNELWLNGHIQNRFRVVAVMESAKPQTNVPSNPVPLKLEAASQLPSVTKAAGLKLGDLDGDGDLDLFVVSLRAPCAMLRNDGKGFFADSGQQLGNNAGYAVALGDLDGDGDLDAFVANTGDQENAIWLNDGRGVFQRSEQSFPPQHSNDVALADVDHDKDLDAVISNWNGSVEIWTNDGAGKFTSLQIISQKTNTGIALGDLDGDGDADLVTTSFRGDNHVLFNDGQGRFTDSEQKIEHADSSSVDLGDLDQDGDLDLFLTTNQGNQVWFNDGRGRFQDSEQLLGGGRCEAVALVDWGDGEPVIGTGEGERAAAKARRSPHTRHCF
ncbi:MAG: VCBS repeat-containing protein [Planctomycetaceae bacterium]|nr:VCBS repeat-containing protein [Planctomycetaceae bacterium]